MYTITIGKEPDNVYCTSLYSVNATTKKHLEDKYLLYFHVKEANRTIYASVTIGSNILTCTDALDDAGIGKILVAEWLQSENLLRSGNALSLIQSGVVSVSWIESELILDRLEKLAELQKDKDKN